MCSFKKNIFCTVVHWSRRMAGSVTFETFAAITQEKTIYAILFINGIFVVQVFCLKLIKQTPSHPGLVSISG